LLLGACVLGVSLAGTPAVAQAPPAQEADPFGAVLFPPDLIMQHGRAIGLDDDQRVVITRLIEQLQGRVLGLQWQLAEQVQALKETLGQSRVDQDRALDQLSRVLETEKNIKQAHLEMLLRIKNVLRPEQQTELTRLRGGTVGRGDYEPEGEP
jgi:Spy/CpxP family protein refolding chaperone